MTSVERLAKLAAPTGVIRKRRVPSAGDGRVCPADPKHGAMIRLRDSSSQYCPDQSHDGLPGQPVTRSFFPGVVE
jgi:hypothetical protein